MRILRLHVEAFGTLRDYDLELNEGLNVLYHENGWGKSTLAAFVKAMLFGLPATGKRSLDENERKKYQPWQGGSFGGSLELICEKGGFRIERFFGAKESGDSFALYDLATNLPSGAYSERIGQELFGIDVGGFERTVYLSQHAVLQKGDNNSITAKLSDLLDDVDDIGSFDGAIAALEKRRKYYVMTGERGRIADLQRELESTRMQSERLMRTEESLRERETDRNALEDQIRATERDLAQVREELRRAGLLRERQAYADQRAQMCAELEKTERQIADLNARMGERHPSAEELDGKRTLLSRILELRARMNEMTATPAAPHKRELLQSDFCGELPSGAVLDDMTESNAELQRLLHREESLRAERTVVGLECFARQAPPDEAEIGAALRSLEHEENERKKNALRNARTGKIACFGTIALDVLLVALSFLPGIGYVGVGIFLGAACLATLIGAWLMVRARAKQKRADHVPAVGTTARKLLARYGMDTSGILRERLTELSLLARQYRESVGRNERTDAALRTLQEQRVKLIAGLRARFAAYGVTLSPKNDYRDDIEALRRDTSLIRRLQSEEEQRRRRYEAAEKELRELQAELTPFLRWYDREGRLKPSDVLAQVQAWENEYRRLQGEQVQRKAALQRFLHEKQLTDDVPEVAENADYDTLEARERTLQNALADLQDRRAELNGLIDRLSIDADRLPEVLASMATLEEEIVLARENSATVANTMRYLEDAKVALSVRYLDDMQTSFSRLLEELIADTPPESVMDPSFEVKLRSGGKTQSMESFSRGWRDAVQLCVRLSLTEALYHAGEAPFLILDDPFVNLDDRRLDAAKQLLVSLSKRYQIIYMVCHAERR